MSEPNFFSKWRSADLHSPPACASARLLRQLQWIQEAVALEVRVRSQPAGFSASSHVAFIPL